MRLIAWFELKIPPPVFVVTAGAVHTLSVTQWPDQSVGDVLWLALGAAVGALVFGLGGVFGCLRHHTTVHPWAPAETSTLVTTGVFAISRNPMYVALLLALAAWVLMPLHPVSPVVLAACFWALMRLQVVPEERILRAKFGDAHAAYCHRVRRWL